MLVDIEGAVMNPGVYELGHDTRIVDALASAGGFSAFADREWVAKNLNKAAKLVDGGKIYIPSAQEKNPVQTPNNKSQIQTNNATDNILGTSEGKINVNTASQSELESLSGVGPVTAEKIINSRPYSSVEELLERKVLGKSWYENNKNILLVVYYLVK